MWARASASDPSGLRLEGARRRDERGPGGAAACGPGHRPGGCREGRLRAGASVPRFERSSMECVETWVRGILREFAPPYPRELDVLFRVHSRCPQCPQGTVEINLDRRHGSLMARWVGIAPNMERLLHPDCETRLLPHLAAECDLQRLPSLYMASRYLPDPGKGTLRTAAQ